MKTSRRVFLAGISLLLLLSSHAAGESSPATVGKNKVRRPDSSQTAVSPRQDSTASTPLRSVGDSGAVKLIPTIAELRRLTGTAGQHVFLQAHTVAGDGGFGAFHWVSGQPPRAYADNNGTVIVPLGGDGSAAWLREKSGGVSVRWFGARGDGVADDTAALNSAADYIRQAVRSADGGRGVILRFPEGTYRVRDSLNFTDIRGKDGIYWGLEGDNANILGECTGKPIFDFMRSLGGRMRGFNIQGSETSKPRCAIQLARGRYSAKGAPESADNFTLEFIRTHGHFSLAALYNFGSERFLAYNCNFGNADTAETSYCIVIDGRNKFAATSDYYKNEIAVDDPVSCLNHQFIKCSFQKAAGGSGGGPAVYMTRASRVLMIGCYAISYTSDAVVMDGDATGFRDIDLNLHCEPAGRLKHAVRFTSSYGSRAYVVRGFRWEENSLHAGSAAIYSDGPMVTLEDAGIHVGGRHGKEPVTLFEPGEKFKVVGVVSCRPTDASLPPGLTLAGTYSPGEAVDSAFLPKGSYTIEDTGSRDLRVKGAQRWHGRAEEEFKPSQAGSQPLAAIDAGSLFLGEPAGQPAVVFGDPANERPRSQLQAFDAASSLRFRVTPDGGATWIPSLTILPSGAMRQPALSTPPADRLDGGESFYSTRTQSFRGYKGGPNPGWGEFPLTLRGSAPLNFPATPAQSSSDLAIPVTGAAEGDEVVLGVPPGAVLANSAFSAFVAAKDSVTVRFNNYSRGAQDPGAGTFLVSVIKR